MNFPYNVKKIQFIIDNTGHPAQIVKKFDYSFLRFAYDLETKNLLFTDESLEHMATKTMVYDRPYDFLDPCTEDFVRAEKWNKRGFK